MPLHNMGSYMEKKKIETRNSTHIMADIYNKTIQAPRILCQSK